MLCGRNPHHSKTKKNSITKCSHFSVQQHAITWKWWRWLTNKQANKKKTASIGNTQPNKVYILPRSLFFFNNMSLIFFLWLLDDCYYLIGCETLAFFSKNSNDERYVFRWTDIELTPNTLTNINTLIYEWHAQNTAHITRSIAPKMSIHNLLTPNIFDLNEFDFRIDIDALESKKWQICME